MCIEPTAIALQSHPCGPAPRRYRFHQLHTVSRTQQGRQREPSDETLRSPLSADFWRHSVLRGRTQRRALPRHQSEEIENINLSKYFISSCGDRIHNQSSLQSHLVPLRHDWPRFREDKLLNKDNTYNVNFDMRSRRN